MNLNTIVCADALSYLKSLPDKSVHCAISSPPYFGLRDYGNARWEGGDADCDHLVGRAARAGLEKGKQLTNAGSNFGDEMTNVCPKCGAKRIDDEIGREPSIAEYVANLLSVFSEVHRVLRDDGVFFLNLGDSWANDAKWGGSTGGKHAKGVHGSENGMRGKRQTGLPAKSMMGIPWRMALALQGEITLPVDEMQALCAAIDGRDLDALDAWRAGMTLWDGLRAQKWILRSDVIWAKQNPMPGSQVDRPTLAHEYIFMLTKKPKYYFDYFAVQEARTSKGRNSPELVQHSPYAPERNDSKKSHFGASSPETRNLRSVWTLVSEHNPHKHFATFPTKLVSICLRAGCPKFVCAKCGAPHKRIVEREDVDAPEWKPYEGSKSVEQDDQFSTKRISGNIQRYRKAGRDHDNPFPKRISAGWTPTCTCDPFEGHEGAGHAGTVPGIVLDPFMGSGTTAVVAKHLGRSYLGCDLNPDYVRMAEARVARVVVKKPLVEGDDVAERIAIATKPKLAKDEPIEQLPLFALGKEQVP